MKKLTYNVAIVGATGLIGRKFIETLEKRSFPVNSARLFASKKSEGKKVFAFGKQLTVETLENNDFKGIDFLLASDGYLLCEVNSNAFFKEFEIVTKINVAELYAKHIVSSL